MPLDRPVFVETSDIAGPAAVHWGVRVGEDDWYEVESKNKEDGCRRVIAIFKKKLFSGWRL